MLTCSNMGNRVLLLDLWDSNRQWLPGYKVALLACFPIKLQICAYLVRPLIGGKSVLQDLKFVPLTGPVSVNSGCSLKGTYIVSAVVAVDVLHPSIKKAGLENWFGLANCCCPLWIFFFFSWFYLKALELCLILISLTTFVRQKLIKLSFHQLESFWAVIHVGSTFVDAFRSTLNHALAALLLVLALLGCLIWYWV